jgi:hypothetical protein
MYIEQAKVITPVVLRSFKAALTSPDHQWTIWIIGITLALPSFTLRVTFAFRDYFGGSM